MRWPFALLMGGLLVAGITASAGAQQTQECELLPGAREAIRTISGGRELVRISGPATFACPGGVTLKADSAVGTPGSGELELIGHVFYQDSVKTLSSGWARYLRVEARLLARDSVVLTDLKSRSVIEGAEMEYLPANENRAEAETIIQGRPHATFYQRDEKDVAPGDSTAPPLEVDSDIMRIKGEDRFLALGQVELTRGETRGYAREGEFDQGAQVITLTGSARLEDDSFNLAGDRIEATLESEKLREVTARRDAVLEGEDMDLRAPILRIFFQEGEIDRLIAMGDQEAGKAAESGGELAEQRSSRPVILSTDLQLVADSIDAVLPGRQLKMVVAVGDAFAVRTGDTLDIGLPEAIAQDWLVGDTITSYFVPAPDSTVATAVEEVEETEVVASDTVAVGGDTLGVRVVADTVQVDTAAAGSVLDDLLRAGTRAADTLASDTLAGAVPDQVVDGERRDGAAGELVGKGASPSSDRKGGRVVLERLVAVGENGRARSLYRIREKGHEGEVPGANYLVAERIVLIMVDGEVKDVEADGPIEGIHLQPVGSGGKGSAQGAPETGAGPVGNHGDQPY